MQLPRTLYQVISDFGDVGIGSHDAEECRVKAYDQYADAVDDGYESRVFEMSFDVSTGALESVREVTSDFFDELCRICAERGHDMPSAA